MKEIKVEELKENPFSLIGKDWFLITAKKDEKINTMTASWGGLGVIWGKNVATIYIRHSRYTKEFVDNSDRFSLCVMPEKFRKELNYCGSMSGRNQDKIKECGFSLDYENEVPYFLESRLTLVCKKLYAKEIGPEGFVSSQKELVDRFYSDKDWHVMYIAKIEKILVE